MTTRISSAAVGVRTRRRPRPKRAGALPRPARAGLEHGHRAPRAQELVARDAEAQWAVG